ncbi:MAG: helix-turn-helix transcriptional regulator [Clostridia bacterium]|nr:helix-turn-helix transcriptional regulator [Clostridia bacterium]
MNNIISQRIKEIRTDNKLNQSEFGKSLSVSQDTISLWENGKSLPNTEFVISICQKYNVSADYLLGLED